MIDPAGGDPKLVAEIRQYRKLRLKAKGGQVAEGSGEETESAGEDDREVDLNDLTDLTQNTFEQTASAEEYVLAGRANWRPAGAKKGLDEAAGDAEAVRDVADSMKMMDDDDNEDREKKAEEVAAKKAKKAKKRNGKTDKKEEDDESDAQDEEPLDERTKNKEKREVEAKKAKKRKKKTAKEDKEDETNMCVVCGEPGGQHTCATCAGHCHNVIFGCSTMTETELTTSHECKLCTTAKDKEDEEKKVKRKGKTGKEKTKTNKRGKGATTVASKSNKRAKGAKGDFFKGIQTRANASGFSEGAVA